MTRKFLAAVTLSFTGALLVSCGTTIGETATEAPIDNGAAASAIAVYELPPDWGSDAGAAQGVLVEVDGCVRLDNSRVPIFPVDQVTWDGESLTFGGEQYQLGDTIEFAGNELGEGDDLELEIPEACSAGPFWVVGPHRG